MKAIRLPGEVIYAGIQCTNMCSTEWNRIENNCNLKMDCYSVALMSVTSRLFLLSPDQGWFRHEFHLAYACWGYSACWIGPFNTHSTASNDTTWVDWIGAMPTTEARFTLRGCSYAEKARGKRLKVRILEKLCTAQRGCPGRLDNLCQLVGLCYLFAILYIP